MIEKVLLIIRTLRDSLPGRSPGKAKPQQKVTAVGDNNIIIIVGDNINSNLILPETKDKVKHFTLKDVEK